MTRMDAPCHSIARGARTEQGFSRNPGSQEKDRRRASWLPHSIPFRLRPPVASQRLFCYYPFHKATRRAIIALVARAPEPMACHEREGAMPVDEASETGRRTPVPGRRSCRRLLNESLWMRLSKVGALCVALVTYGRNLPAQPYEIRLQRSPRVGTSEKVTAVGVFHLDQTTRREGRETRACS
jgi:hypothetical protein